MWHYSRTRQQAESTKLNVCYVPVWVSISVIVTKEVVLANLEKKLQLSYWVRRNIMPTVLSRAIFRGWSTLESRSSHNSGTWTYHPSRTWLWQSKTSLVLSNKLEEYICYQVYQVGQVFLNLLGWQAPHKIEGTVKLLLSHPVEGYLPLQCLEYMYFFLFYYSATRPCGWFQVSDGPWWPVSSFIWSGRYWSVISLQHL